MTILVMAGAVVLTVLAFYPLLMLLVFLTFSDESLWHTISWNWKGFLVYALWAVATIALWWFVVALPIHHHVHIHIN